MKTCKSFARDGKADDGRTAGREGNFEQLLRGCAEKAHSFACRLAGNEDEAEELVQQASYRALRNWERYDPLESFQAWYLTLVRRVFIDIRRSVHHRYAIPFSAKVGKKEGRELSEVLADGEPGLLEQLERKEQEGAARRALETLREEHKALIVLCDIEGMSYEETARRLGIPEGTVRSRLFRARAMLRRKAGVA